MNTDFKFPVSLQLRLDWSELDPFGHINNVMYFKYLQASRVAYWERLGLSVLNNRTGMGPLLASTRCDFRRPLYYPGQIEVRASVSFLKNTSFGLCHRILDSTGEIAAEGQDVVVLYDYQAHRKVSIPDDLRAVIEQLEDRRYADGLKDPETGQ